MRRRLLLANISSMCIRQREAPGLAGGLKHDSLLHVFLERDPLMAGNLGQQTVRRQVVRDQRDAFRLVLLAALDHPGWGLLGAVRMVPNTDARSAEADGSDD